MIIPVWAYGAPLGAIGRTTTLQKVHVGRLRPKTFPNPFRGVWIRSILGRTLPALVGLGRSLGRNRAQRARR